VSSKNVAIFGDRAFIFFILNSYRLILHIVYISHYLISMDNFYVFINQLNLSKNKIKKNPENFSH
jgi:hypothetical protein